MKQLIKKVTIYFNLKFLIGLTLFCLLGAIINNIRVSEEKSVEWIGSQEILEKPEDVL